MKLILHGENIVASRDYLNQIRTNYQGEIITLSGKTINLGDLKQAAESLSLFFQNRLIIIDSLFSRPLKKELNQFLDYLIAFKSDYDFILWEEKEIKAKTLQKFPLSWEIKLYKLPKVMFTFLDSISPSNKRKMLLLIKDLRKTASDDFIYLMIVRQVRLLLLAKEKSLTGMPSWMMGKFVKQASNFTRDKLLDIYKKLLMIDIRVKTGSAVFTLGQELDLLLATI